MSVISGFHEPPLTVCFVYQGLCPDTEKENSFGMGEA